MSSCNFSEVGVIGAGAWGTALAYTLSKNVNDVILWDRDAEVVDGICHSHENTRHLKGHKLPENLRATHDLNDLKHVKLLVLVVPAQVVREVAANLRKVNDFKVPIVICSKGIENGSLELMSQVVSQIFENSEIAVLSGPNFAKEVIAQKPAATTIACLDKEIGREIANAFSSSCFRCYLSDDLIGVQVSGAVKNVLAIAAGVVDGASLGENAKAAMITRGLAEIAKLTESLGGNKETLMGLAGIGDLMLTCGTRSSRNMEFGYQIGLGRNASDVLEQSETTIEGYYSTISVKELMDKHDLDMPICNAVHQIVHKGMKFSEVVEFLMTRPIKEEF